MNERTHSGEQGQESIDSPELDKLSELESYIYRNELVHKYGIQITPEVEQGIQERVLKKQEERLRKARGEA